MTTIASRAFLSHLKSLYPASNARYVQRPWYHVAGTAYAASNRPEGVSAVYRMASEEAGERHEDQLLLVRKMRDAIFQAGLNAGYPRSINALIELKNATPEHLQDDKPLRDVTRPIAELHDAGVAMFQAAYGPTAAPVESLLSAIYPDFWFFCKTVGYGFTYGFNGVLSPAEVSYTLIAALVATDAPRQLEWHLHNALRNGATRAEVRAVRQICVEVSGECGVRWRGALPDLNDGDSEDGQTVV